MNSSTNNNGNGLPVIGGYVQNRGTESGFWTTNTLWHRSDRRWKAGAAAHTCEPESQRNGA